MFFPLTTDVVVIVEFQNYLPDGAYSQRDQQGPIKFVGTEPPKDVVCRKRNDLLRIIRSSFNTATVTDFFYEELEKDQTTQHFLYRVCLTNTYIARAPENALQ